MPNEFQRRFTGDERVLVPGTLRGYRAWDLYGGRLHSIYMEHSPWASGWVTARCNLPLAQPQFVDHEGQHPAPDAECACGIYAWYRHQDIPDTMYGVTGIIEVKGHVLIGEKGFRAEKARIVALLFPRGTPMEFAASLYHDVELFTSCRKFRRAYPPQDVSALTGVTPVREPSRLVSALALIWASGVVSFALSYIPEPRVLQHSLAIVIGGSVGLFGNRFHKWRRRHCARAVPKHK
jgi:hypothetical protein